MDELLKWNGDFDSWDKVVILLKECTDENPCKDYDECMWCCQHIKPCECGCGHLGGSCDAGCDDK
jgi:hypothetical protein